MRATAKVSRCRARPLRRERCRSSTDTRIGACTTTNVTRVTHAQHAKYRLAHETIDSYSHAVAMTKPTIGRLFELLTEPTVHTDSEIARLLDIDLVLLRARLVDLKSRGILTGPFEDGPRTTWRSWYPTLLATTAALERSGLRATRPVPLRRSWWDGMWADEHP